jgi:hypothetical protein
MLNTFVRRSLLGVALAGLMVTNAAQAQNKDAAKDAAKAQKDATKDAAKAQKDAVKDAKLKKDKDRDPSASTNKTKGKHKAIGHTH